MAFELDVILLIAVLAICLMAGVLVYRYLEIRKRVFSLEKNQSILQSDMRAMVSAAVGLGERVRELEHRLRGVSERQEQQELCEPASQSYHQARKLAQRGMEADELSEIYGLTRGEAELISMLNKMEAGNVSRDCSTTVTIQHSMKQAGNCSAHP